MYNLKEILNKLTSEKKVLIIGAAIVDIIINIEKLPHSGEDITAKSTKHTIGGCAFNVADVLNKLHLPFDLMIPIGNGDYSKIIYKSFKEKNYPIFKIEENIRRPKGIFDSPMEVNMVERILYINRNGNPTK